jgi:hypothetical protein
MQTPRPPQPSVDSRYHVSHRGQILGVLPLAEIRHQRAGGELTGEEFVWREGMAEWRPVDALLGEAMAASASPAHSPAPSRPATSKGGWSGSGRWIVIGVAAMLVFAGLSAAAGFWAWRQVREQIEQNEIQADRPLLSEAASAPDGIELAGPIAWPSTTKTALDDRPVEADFRTRHYLNAYLKHGRRDHPDDADAVRLIEAWNITWLAGATPQEKARFWELHAKLAARLPAQDPFVRVLLVTTDSRISGRIGILEGALADLEKAGYPAMSRLWATACLISERDQRTIPLEELYSSALGLLRRALGEGELTPEDGVQMADRFVDGWATFFRGQREEICAIFAEAGPEHRWTSLVLEGERQIALAWKARGGGYANTVTEAGWDGFRVGLERASEAFNEAWRIHPERAQAAARMVYVSMGRSDTTGMRRWFDRATAARIDHRGAWVNLRFGLYPRWHGSHEAMLKLGIEALNTERFDTFVPDQFYDIVSAIENDLNLPKGNHLYGRADIWPHLRRMYEGYIAEEHPKVVPWRKGWRSGYACVAFIAEDYATARTQLEALDWNPEPGHHPEWDIDLPLMPFEVAARTGAHAKETAEAEAAWDRGETAEAKARFQRIFEEAKDDRTREFARRRVAGAEGAGF